MHLLVAAIAWTALATVPASADDVARADALFAQGKQLMSALKFGDACNAFEASQLLDARTSTLVNLGDCRERNRQYSSAIDSYLMAERELRAEPDASSVQLRKLVKARIQQLAPRLSSLKVKVSSAVAIEITRDGEPVEADTLNREIAIDGGTHRIVARAPGGRAWTTTVQVQATNDRQVVVIPPLVAAR